MAEFTVDRYSGPEFTRGWNDMATIGRETPKKDPVMERAKAEERVRDRREKQAREVESSLARRLRPEEEGGDMLARFVMDSEGFGKKLQAMVNAGDFAGAQKSYDDFRSIIQGNLNDLVDFTRDKVRSAGSLGRVLAERSDALLRGDFDQLKVLAGDEETTIGQVLGLNATYQGYKRKSLQSLGFSDAAADMYFGERGETARVLMQQAINPLLDAKNNKVTPEFSVQLSDLVGYISHTDNDGDFDNLSKLEGTFGSSAGLVLRDVVERHRGVGGFASALGLFQKIGENLRNDTDTGESLAAKTASTYSILRQAALAGLTDPNKPDPQSVFMFNAALGKTFDAIRESGRPIDPTSPALAKGMRRLFDEVAWWELMDVNVAGAAADAGSSWCDSMGRWVAAGMVGDDAPGYARELASLRSALSTGVRGASRPDAHYTDVRSGAEARQKAILQSSELMGLDGVAWGFDKVVSGAFVPRLSDGSTTVDGAREAIVGDDDAKRTMFRGLANVVGDAIPFSSKELRNTLALAMWSAWTKSGGTQMVVEDVFNGVLNDAGMSSRLSDRDKEELRTWLAANTGRDSDHKRWRELLTAHYKQEYPDDDAAATMYVARKMAELEKARLSGDDVEDLLLGVLAQGRYLYLQKNVDENGNPVDVEYQYRDKGGNIAQDFVAEGWGDRTQQAEAEGVSLDQYMSSQRALGIRLKAEDRARRDWQTKKVSEALRQSEAEKKNSI